MDDNSRSEEDDNNSRSGEDDNNSSSEEDDNNSSSEEDDNNSRSGEDDNNSSSEEDDNNSSSEEDDNNSRSEEDDNNSRSEEDDNNSRSEEDDNNSRSEEDDSNSRSEEDDNNSRSEEDDNNSRTGEDDNNSRTGEDDNNSRSEEDDNNSRTGEDDNNSRSEEDGSDQESLNGLDTDESFVEPVSSRAKVITKESLLAAQSGDLSRVMEKLSLKEKHARALLIHYRWDVEKLFALLDEQGKDSLFSDAGLIVLENQLCDSSSMMRCDVCIEDVQGHQMTQMDCGHSFCNNCWAGHFSVKINEGWSKRIICMTHKCNAICDEDVVRTLVSESQPDLAEKFDRVLLESYIEDNKMVKWCPSIPHCGNAIRVENEVLCEVECSCGLQFCFNCSSEAHSPCSCVMWELWRKKEFDEFETDNWMSLHTRTCPRCHKRVEKIDGYNLVTCICGQSFCWLCGEATVKEQTRASSEGHSCVGNSEEFWRTSWELKQYTLYYNMYKRRIDASKIEDVDLSDSISEKVSILEKKELQLKDFSWVTNGLNRLLRTRRYLSYSYPFSFYMFEGLFKDEKKKDGKEKELLFRSRRLKLEDKLNYLSGELYKFVEESFDQFADDKVIQIRNQINDLSVAVDTLCKEMYICIRYLLGWLQLDTYHNIAPYRSNGIERASDFDSSQNSEEAAGAGTSRLDQASGSGNSEDATTSSSNK